MAIGYVLRCRCAATVVVGASQAGQTIACQQCGDSLQVPTLLELRRLERVDIQESRKRPGGWAVWRLLLLIGVLLALVGSAGCLYALQNWPTPPQDHFSRANLERDALRLSPLESLRLWRDIIEGVDASRKSIYERAFYNYMATRQKHWLWAGVAMAVAGLVLAGTALTLRTARTVGSG